VQQTSFIVTEYYKTGGSVVRVQKKICTEFLSLKGPTKNAVWRLAEQPKEMGSLLDERKGHVRQTSVRTSNKTM
jgi:hypothetical protein